MKIAIITGASSGIGVEFVKETLKTRPDLDEIWVLARREERLLKLRKELGDKIRVFAMDITDTDALLKLCDTIKSEKATVALLINNAGYGKLGDFDTLQNSDNEGMIALNCKALTMLCRLCLDFMEEESEIINVCSIASFAPNARMAVYSATKAFVMSFSRALRYELKARKINVLAACPGPMETEFLSLADITPGKSRTFDTLPRVSPVKMARGALKASARRRSVYTNHIFYKFYRLISKILPHSIVMLLAKT